jgi:hypothetical protein
MTEENDKKPKSEKDDRAARLAAQLRANLRRRKDQARTMDMAEKGADAADGLAFDEM